MSIPAFIRRAIYLLAAIVLCFVFTPGRAAADQIYDVTFSGTGTCAAGTCNGSTVTGTYVWDMTTDSPVGNWSFDTPVGDFSGVGGPMAEPSQDVTTPKQFQSGFNLLLFVNSDSTLGIQLGFSGADGFDGTLAPTDGSGDILSIAASLPGGANSFDLTSGTAIGTLVSSTPEPSALLLLGLGFTAFFIIRRRNFNAVSRALQP